MKKLLQQIQVLKLNSRRQWPLLIGSVPARRREVARNGLGGVICHGDLAGIYELGGIVSGGLLTNLGGMMVGVCSQCSK